MKTQKEIEEQIEEIRTMLEEGDITWQDYIQRYSQVVLGLEWVLYGNASKENETQSEKENKTQSKKETTTKHVGRPKLKISRSKYVDKDGKYDRNAYMKDYNKKKRLETKKLLNKVSSNVKEVAPTKELQPTNPVV
jgi:hypothetical protein